MPDFVTTHVVTSERTEIWFDAHTVRSFVVLGLGDHLGSGVRIRLRSAEIDRLVAVLGQAREALRGAREGRRLT